jgi:ABC-2 type transport system ATP-binding protein
LAPPIVRSAVIFFVLSQIRPPGNGKAQSCRHQYPAEARMLAAQHLRKSYAAHEVVCGVSLEVKPGEIVGLLGPNGAGKTTTIGMICGLTPPDNGEVLVNGQSIGSGSADAKRQLGLVPQDLALFETLSARINLETFGALYGLGGAPLKARAEAALELVGLSDRADEKVANFSGGMKRRLNIACALVHDPAILLLDEPTVGVDPQSRNAIFDNLETLKAQGKAIVYTTHYMEEAERLCDRVIIMDHGKVIASDTLAGLYRLLPVVQSLEIDLDGNVDLAALMTEPGVKRAEQTNGHLTIGIDDLTTGSPVVLAWLAQRGHHISRVSSGRATLETLFLTLTGRQLRD